MEKIRVLCYGDSNTWGFIPAGNHKRYDRTERWTSLLSEKLYDIINNIYNRSVK